MAGHRQNDSEWDDDSDDALDEYGADDPHDESSSWDNDESETQPCPYCRREIHEDAERCPYCERYLSDEDSEGRTTARPLWFVIGFVLCVVVLFFWMISLG